MNLWFVHFEFWLLLSQRKKFSVIQSIKANKQTKKEKQIQRIRKENKTNQNRTHILNIGDELNKDNLITFNKNI